jgi:hypothetical protein
MMLACMTEAVAMSERWNTTSKLNNLGDHACSPTREKIELSIIIT